MATTIQNDPAPVFMGEFCHAIDGKNRITIPSAWRPAEKKGTELFLIPSSSANCLTVMPRAAQFAHRRAQSAGHGRHSSTAWPCAASVRKAGR